MSSIDIKEELTKIGELVEPFIKELLTDDVEKKTAEIAYYQCKLGGKRIRPALLAISGQMFGADIKDLMYPAASLEILHNTTLIIDDIIDHSEFRRSQPTCWNKFGRSMAECASLIYMPSVFLGLNYSKNSSKLIDLYGKTLKIVVDGEIKDILFERSGRDDEPYVVENRYPVITKDDYLMMISQKTAVLLRASCVAGAICADADDKQIETISDFGFNLGMAFQIRDDILDIFGDEKEFGKKIGKDIIEKKMGNFVILSAIEKLDSTDRDVVVNILESSKEVSDEDVATVKALIDKTDAKTIAEDVAKSYIQKSFDALKQLPQNGYNDQLQEIAKYIIGRNK